MHHPNEGFEQPTQGQANSKKEDCRDQGEAQNLEKSVRKHTLSKHAVPPHPPHPLPQSKATMFSTTTLTFFIFFFSGYASSSRDKKTLEDTSLEREKEQLIQDIEMLEQKHKEMDMIHGDVEQDRRRAGKIKSLISTKHTVRLLGYFKSIR